LLSKYSIIQKILVGLASQKNFVNSKNDPPKMTRIKNLIKNVQKSLWLELKIFNLEEKYSCKNHNLKSILEGIFNFWHQILLKNIGLCTNRSNHMDMIHGSYFTTIVWESSLNHSSKLGFIRHLYNFGILEPKGFLLYFHK